MPTQQTNLPSGTGRDAGALGLDVSIASVKDAMDAVLATPRANAPLASDDVWSEKQSAGLPADSTRSGMLATVSGETSTPEVTGRIARTK
jgi:hypothetical protein